MTSGEIHIQGVRILRKEAYEQYAGRTKDEHNAVDESLPKSSLLKFDCIADDGLRPPGRAKRVHVGIGGQNIFI